MRIRIAVAALLVAALSAAAWASPLDVRRTAMPNGLTVLHVERHNLPMVVMSLVINAGSYDEPADRAGLASLTASLLTEGTKTRPAGVISNEIEFMGASLSASAGADYTTVGLTTLKKDLPKGMEIMSDVLLSPAFSDAELARKKKLTIGALRQKYEDPEYIAFRRFGPAVYGEANPYSRDEMGSAETVERITRDDVQKFYQTYYKPGSAILAVAGDISPEELDALLAKYLGAWSRGARPARTAPEQGRFKPDVIGVDRDLTQATILLGHRGVRRDNPDYYALNVMNYILGAGGFSSRLMDSVRDRMGLAYGIYSMFAPASLDGIFFVSVQTKNASAQTVVDETLAQIRKIRDEQVSDDELADAKAYLTGSFPRKLDTMAKITSFLCQVEYFGLGLDYQDKYAGYINSVTKEDVMRVAKRYLDPERYVLVVVAKLSEAKIGSPAPAAGNR